MPIEALFPLAIYYADLDDAKEHNASMLETIIQLENSHPSEFELEQSAWTGDVQGVGNIHDDPRFRWLTDQVEIHCMKYLQEMGYDMHKIDLYIQRSWPVVSRKDQGVGFHAHHNANISAVYYVTVPETSEPNDSGAFVVHNTANQNEFQEGISTNRTEVISDWNTLNYKSMQYAPVPGRLMLFPSRQQHSVEPNQTTQLRISISFDIVMTSSRHVPRDTQEFLPPPPERWSPFRNTPRVRTTSLEGPTYNPAETSQKEKKTIPMLVEGIDLMRPMTSNERTILVYQNKQPVTSLNPTDDWMMEAVAMIADQQQFTIDEIRDRLDVQLIPLMDLCQELKRMKLLEWVA